MVFIAMKSHLLVTKLFAPVPRTQLLVRPRVLKNFKTSQGGICTLISAPAGFGKTSLVLSWLEQTKTPTAWLSLDTNDNEVGRFFLHLFATLARAGLKINGESIPSLPADILITQIINALVISNIAIELVLDDYHLINNKEIHKAFGFLLDNLPSQLHLIITTRADPPLNLPRLRIKGQLNEIRAQDLRFQTDEITDLLKEALELVINRQQVEILEQRTEGWIAALQMVILSVKDQDDLNSYIERFGGAHRLVAEYLVDEVLNRQFKPVQDFLLKTAILERMCAPLCNALLENDDSQVMLEQLENQNLFLIPLDGEKKWYRYHHLFAELLQHRLEQSKVAVAELHKKASQWFDNQDYLLEAVEHALKGQDFERAASILAKQNFNSLYKEGYRYTLMRWLKQLPKEVVINNPNFSLWLAAAKITTHQLDEIEAHLQDVEAYLNNKNLPEENLLKGFAESIRTTVCFMAGDPKGIIEKQTIALKLLPENYPALAIVRNAPTVHAGLAWAYLGELEKGKAVLWEARAEAKTKDIFEMYNVSGQFLAQIFKAEGMLTEAEQIVKETLGHLENSKHNLNVKGHIASIVLHCVIYETNRLEKAKGLLEDSLNYVLKLSVADDLESLVESGFLLALIAIHGGDEQKAQAYSDDIAASVESLPDRSFVKKRGHAVRALIALRLGDLVSASYWAKQQKLPEGDGLSFACSLEHFILARILIAMQDFDKAEDLLAVKLNYAKNLGLTGDVIEAQMLLAKSQCECGHLEPALTLLIPTLELAGPLGYVRIFLDEGEIMQGLLEQAQKRNPSSYIKKLLKAFAEKQDITVAEKSIALDKTLEGLSKRELEVLRLMSEGLSNKQIAKKLTISPATVKRHSVNIYSKLMVSSRTQAAAKAREMGFL